jgi:cytochrome P450
MDKNLFEIAFRRKYRFPSVVGELTTEQLWDLPLTSTRGACLDNVAKTVSGNLKMVSDESFVVTTPNPRKGELENMLEIIKHVIAVKIEDRRRADAAADRADKRRKLIEALANKQDDAIKNLSEDEIKAKLAELDDAA